MRFAQVKRRRSAVALTDQILISGSNFLASIVLVRGLGLPEFGKYTIAFVLLMYFNALQMSFVGSPMLSIAPLLEGEEKKRFMAGMLAVQLLCSLGLLTIVLVVGLIARIFTSFYSLPCLIAFAFCVGTYQLQDWLRRYYFVYNEAKYTLLSDFLSYFVQLLALAALWRVGKLTLFMSFVVMCATSVAGFAIGPIIDPLRPAMSHMRQAWAKCRKLSRDLLIANQVRWFGVQGVLLIGTGIVGTAAAGGLRATLSLAGPMNLLMTALENVLPLKIGEQLKKNGARGAYRFTRNVIIGGSLLFAVVSLPVAIFGKHILHVLYGPAMVPFYWPMLLQLLSLAVQAVSNLWVYFYRSVGDTKPLIQSYALSAVVSVLTVYAFGHFWGASGIVLSSIVGISSGVLHFVWHWLRARTKLSEQFPPQSEARLRAAVISASSAYADVPCE